MSKSFGKPRRMPNGVLVYPKRGREPPPDHEGFQRDPKDYWRFVPQWPECKFRILNMHMAPCGALRPQALCQHPEKKGEVSYQVCSGCPLRK